MLSFTLRGRRVELRFSCFALLAFCCLFGGPSGAGAAALAVALHECTHLGAMLLFRAPPRAVRLSALGCRVELDPQRPLSYGQNAVVSLAGPAANLFCFALLRLGGATQSFFAASSLALGLFHALPVEPLDGGLALRAVLSALLPVEKAQKISFAVSLALLTPLAALGFLVLLRTRYNFTLLALAVYMMLYLVLKRDHFA